MTWDDTAHLLVVILVVFELLLVLNSAKMSGLRDCGKVQLEPGIGSHLLFKGAPIWPTAPLICEAASLVRLFHHRLSSVADSLIQDNQDVFFKYKRKHIK